MQKKYPVRGILSARFYKTLCRFKLFRIEYAISAAFRKISIIICSCQSTFAKDVTAYLNNQKHFQIEAFKMQPVEWSMVPFHEPKYQV